MNRRLVHLILAAGPLLAPVLVPAAASAAASESEAPVYLTGDLGWFDLQKEDERAPSLQLEFQPDIGYWTSVPTARATLAPTDPAGMGPSGVGIGLELPVGESFSFTPSVAAGLQPRTDAVEPGTSMEFRSGAELSYQFGNDWKLGATYFHVTNGGLVSDQPGNDVFTFTFTVPIGQ